MGFIGPIWNEFLSTVFSVDFTHQDEGKFVPVPKHYAIKAYAKCSGNYVSILSCVHVSKRLDDIFVTCTFKFTLDSEQYYT
jgi:hypothetical protein